MGSPFPQYSGDAQVNRAQYASAPTPNKQSTGDQATGRLGTLCDKVEACNARLRAIHDAMSGTGMSKECAVDNPKCEPLTYGLFPTIHARLDKLENLLSETQERASQIAAMVGA